MEGIGAHVTRQTLDGWTRGEQMRHPRVSHGATRQAAAILLVVGMLAALSGCASKSASRDACETPLSTLPRRGQRLNVGPALAEAEVPSSSVEPTSLADIGGDGSSAWGPAHATKPGHRWMIIRAYATNKSWDYPPVDLGAASATLTVRGHAVEADSVGGGGRSAIYRKSGDGLPFGAVSNINNAQVFFDSVYQVPSAPATYTLTWNLGKVGTARLIFRF